MVRLLLLPIVLAPWALAGPASAAEPGWPVEHHEVEVSLDPSTAGLRATDVLHLAPAARDEESLHFLLHAGLDVLSVTLDGEELEHRARKRWRPRDFFDRPDYSELAGFAVARQHDVTAPEGGWPERARVRVEYAGAVYDSLRPPDVAYGRGFETTSGLVDPRGAFLGGETFWVPWTSEGRFTFRVTTSLPVGWQSMAQGRRAEFAERDGRSWSVWDESHPQEQIHLVAGPYVVREREHRGVALYTYTYENTEPELCDRYLDAAAEYLDLYGDRIGPYPFAKWALVENWWQTGFGMPGFTLLGDRVIRLPFIVHTSYGHEILHCWWGNGVYVDYARGNWCEGLTAFGADYFYKERESAQAARDYRRDMLVGYLDFASSGEKDFPLREFRERSDFGTQAIGYGKSLMVFQMLRDEVGVETFDRALSVFYDEHRFVDASWEDIATVFSRVSGRELDPWFEQWVERPGALDLSLGDLRRDGGAWEVELVQKGAPYEARVPLRLVREGEDEVRRVELSGASTWVRVDGDVDALAVDPDYQLFRRLYREEIPPTFSQALGADSSLVVIGAETTPEVAKALREVGESWSRNQNMRVIGEDAYDDEFGAGRALFVLGEGPLARRALEATAGFGDEAVRAVERAAAATQSLVYTTRDPDDAERAWVVLLPASAEVCEALGRKLPHYSRYSWLRFDGEENVGKGAWTVVESPLHLDLERRGR